MRAPDFTVVRHRVVETAGEKPPVSRPRAMTPYPHNLIKGEILDDHPGIREIAETSRSAGRTASLCIQQRNSSHINLLRGGDVGQPVPAVDMAVGSVLALSSPSTPAGYRFSWKRLNLYVTKLDISRMALQSDVPLAPTRVGSGNRVVGHQYAIERYFDARGGRLDFEGISLDCRA